MKESKKTDVLLMFVALLLGTLGAVMMCLASTAAAQGMDVQGQAIFCETQGLV